MVSLTVAHPAPRRSRFAETRFGKFGAHLAGLFEILGAAIRVSQAVESRRDPHRDDLLTLGITKPLPKVW